MTFCITGTIAIIFIALGTYSILLNYMAPVYLGDPCSAESTLVVWDDISSQFMNLGQTHLELTPIFGKIIFEDNEYLSKIYTPINSEIYTTGLISVIPTVQILSYDLYDILKLATPVFILFASLIPQVCFSKKKIRALANRINAVRPIITTPQAPVPVMYPNYSHDAIRQARGYSG